MAKKQAEAPNIPLPRNIPEPTNDMVHVYDGNYSADFSISAYLEYGTVNECRKVFKLIAKHSMISVYCWRLVDDWFDYKLDFLSYGFYMALVLSTEKEAVKQRQAAKFAREYERLAKMRKLFLGMLPIELTARAWTQAAIF